MAPLLLPARGARSSLVAFVFYVASLQFNPLAGEAPVSLANLLEQFIQLLLVAAVLEEGVEQLRELATPVVV